jgi:hypothetical protein
MCAVCAARALAGLAARDAERHQERDCILLRGIRQEEGGDTWRTISRYIVAHALALARSHGLTPRRRCFASRRLSFLSYLRFTY